MDLEKVLSVWEYGNSIPDGDFRTIITQIQSKLKAKYTVIPDYDKILNSLFQVVEKIVQEKMMTYAWSVPEGMNTKTFNFSLVGNLEKSGFIPAVENNDFGDLIKPYELLHVNQDEVLRLVTSIIANYDSEKYDRGIFYLLADWIYWGQSCWWDNPDTVGGGDRNFTVTQDTLTENRFHFSFTNYQEYVVRLPLPISQLQSNIAVLESVEQVKNTSQLSFVGTGSPDDLLIASFGEVGGQSLIISDIYAEVHTNINETIRVSGNPALADKYGQNKLGVVSLIEKPEGLTWGSLVNDKLKDGLEIKPYQKLGLAIDKGVIPYTDGSMVDVSITVVTVEGLKYTIYVTKSPSEPKTEKGLAYAIALEFLKLEHYSDGKTGALFTLKFGENRVVTSMSLMPEVETVPQKIIWTTDAGKWNSRPLSVFTMPSGSRGTQLNFANGSVNFDAPAGSCFELIIDTSSVIQKSTSDTLKYMIGFADGTYAEGKVGFSLPTAQTVNSPSSPLQTTQSSTGIAGSNVLV